MIRIKLVALSLLLTLFRVMALAIDVPGDEATNRKLLALWKDDPAKIERLRQTAAAFRALPKERQELIEKLDRDLHALPADDQARLKAVMERYANWLARLPEEQRQRLAQATTSSERLKVIDDILDRQWQDALPKPDKDALAKANDAERAKLLEKLREKEEVRRKLRVASRRTIEESAALGPLGFNQPMFRERINTYVEESLRPLLGPEEQQLNLAFRGGPNRHFTAIFNLSDGRSPLPFPGPAPPGRKKAIRSWRDLPADVVKKFADAPVRGAAENEGKWPQFALAVSTTAQERRIKLPNNLLGPTKLEEMPPSVQRFIRDDLVPKLSDGEKQQLAAAADRWPDYPKKIKELAERHRLEVPGIALPGSRDDWQRLLRIFKQNRAADK